MKRRARIITRLYKAQREYEWLMDERNGYLVRGRRIRQTQDSCVRRSRLSIAHRAGSKIIA